MPVRVSSINLLPDDQFVRLIARSRSVKEVLRYFGLGPSGNNRETIKKRIKKLHIDGSHLGRPELRVPVVAKTLKEILVRDSDYSRSHLKGRLLKAGLLKNECSICGLGSMWKDKPIRMRLDHENGIRNDNRLSNLRMVCPNCDSQLDTFSNKNWARTKPRRMRLCSGCGVKINKHGKHGKCVKCFAEANTKINWPPLEELTSMVESSSFVATGRILGVTDNAVRKRIRKLRVASLTSVAVPTMGMSDKSVELAS